MSKCAYCEKSAEIQCSMCQQSICTEHKTSLGGKILCTKCMKKTLMPLAAILIAVVVVILILIFVL